MCEIPLVIKDWSVKAVLRIGWLYSRESISILFKKRATVLRVAGYLSVRLTAMRVTVNEVS